MNKGDLKFSPGDLLVPRKRLEHTYIILLVARGTHHNEYKCYGIHSDRGIKIKFMDTQPFYIGREHVEEHFKRIASNVTNYLMLFLRRLDRL